MIEAIKQFLSDNAHLGIDEKVAIYNEIVDAAKQFIGLPHPVLGVKLVKSEEVVGNDYNPNKVAPPEMRLLRHSIRKDGITMPVVAAADKATKKHVVVDGFHRTSLIQHDAEIRDSLCGYVPLVELNKSVEDRMTSTVRHNMARGTHQVELSAKLVTALTKHHWTNEKISAELGMEPDEVLRLKQITGLAEAFRDREFSRAWQ
jgi:ParB-like chromosome segregation protein Spo0J